MRCLDIERIILVDLEKNTPIKMNGIPKPNEYASNKPNDIDGVVTASVSIVPSMGPTHGVHPIANAKPKINDIG